MPFRVLEDPHNPENSNAGNGGDLIKHSVGLSLLRFLKARSPWNEGLRLRECHAGRGVYRIAHGDPRRETLQSLMTSGGVLAAAQRAALQRLSLPWGEWYAGSAVLYGQQLGAEDEHEAFEWDPDTRAILREVCSAVISPHRDGESQIAERLPEWDARDVILLDPFGLWRRPKLSERRARYARIVEAWLAHAGAPPVVAWFWTWPSANAARGDLDGTAAPVADGYQALRARLHQGGHAFLRVVWCWDIHCAMWIVAPKAHLAGLRDAVEATCLKVMEVGPQATLFISIDAPAGWHG